jgi:hypothetical protein
MCSLFAARPYHTDDPGTTEQGKFELETAVDYWNNSALPGIVFKHGITEKMELDIPLGYVVSPADEKGVSPLALYAKFAIIPDMFAITFTGAFSERFYAVNGIFSKVFGNFRINANLGGTMVADSNDADLTYNLSGTYTFFEKLETGAELCGTLEELNWWQIGAKYFFTDWFSLDAGIGGDFEKKINMNATTGLWFAFPIKKDKGE